MVAKRMPYQPVTDGRGTVHVHLKHGKVYFFKRAGDFAGKLLRLKDALQHYDPDTLLYLEKRDARD